VPVALSKDFLFSYTYIPTWRGCFPFSTVLPSTLCYCLFFLFTNLAFNISGFPLVSVYCLLLPSLAFLYHSQLMFCFKLVEVREMACISHIPFSPSYSFLIRFSRDGLILLSVSKESSKFFYYIYFCSCLLN
jgi:hypothetical protein